MIPGGTQSESTSTDKPENGPKASGPNLSTSGSQRSGANHVTLMLVGVDFRTSSPEHGPGVPPEPRRLGSLATNKSRKDIDPL
jgi:hypothetical protein